jgi:hypothetical protein
MKVRISKWSLSLIGLALSHPALAASKDVERAAGAAAGIFAGIYVHELGHAAADRAAGATEIRILVPGTQCPLLCGETQATWRAPPSQAQGKVISAAGFIASNLAAELMLQHEASARSGFGQGLIATNLYSNAAHVFTYYTRVRGRNGYRGNDIDAYELAGGNPHLLSAGLLAYSVYTLHRARKKEIPILFMRVPF